MFPVIFRRIPEVSYIRERLELDDGDFLDLDWSRVGGDHVVIIAHGLEGSSQRRYVKGMVRMFNQHEWDAVALNFRGCSGEPNRLLRFYHSGVSDDLWDVAEHVSRQRYKRIGLLGFSLGGNVALKLLGELGDTTPEWLIGGVGISVPCDLKTSSESMARLINRPYMMRFISDLHAKIRAKRMRFPDELDDSGYNRIKTFRHFDDRYTAPLHGFRDAEDYWAQCSSRFFFKTIRRPALLVNAADDPFLGSDCFPTDLARRHDFLHLEIPTHGGHVGFVENNHRDNNYYSERRAFEFLNGIV